MRMKSYRHRTQRLFPLCITFLQLHFSQVIFDIINPDNPSLIQVLKLHITLKNQCRLDFTLFFEDILSSWQDALHRCLSTISRFSAHWIKGRTASQSCFPSSVREYSTRGGISGKDSRWMRFSIRRSFNTSARVLGLIPLSLCIMSLNRIFSWWPMMLMIRMAHFFAMILMIPSRGHRQMIWLLFSIVTSKL